MKRKLLTLFAAISLLNTANAQVSAYTFAQSTGTYAPITGGTVLGDTTKDDQSFVDPATAIAGGTTSGPGFPIGFNFTYNGIVFDRVGISNNGWIGLGQAALTPSVNLNSSGITNRELILSGTSTATPAILRNRIAGLGIDLKGQVGSELRIETIGTTPNRQCVIQWKGFKRYPTVPSATNYTFQIRLNETSNTVNVIFGTMTPGTISYRGQTGLGGTTRTDFNDRTTTTNWAATAVGSADTATCALTTTVFPASGQTFLWTPGAPCTGTPTAGTASAPSATCSGVNFALALTGYSSGVSGITFQWKSSPTGLAGSFTNIVAGTTSTFTTSQTATTYYQCIVTCTASTLSSTSNTVTVAMSAPSNCFCTPVHSIGCSSTDNIDSVSILLTTLMNYATGCTGTNGNAYTAYPASGNTTATLTAGNTYTLKVTTKTNNIISVWIDYNRNGIFETNEWNQVCTTSVANVPKTVSIAIPSTAFAGLTRMRIRSRGNGSVNDATSSCTTFFSGETEDYTINMSSLFTSVIDQISNDNNLVVYPNPTNGKLNVNFKAESNSLNVKLMNVGGQLIYNENVEHFSGTYNSMINIAEQAKGIYFLQITSDNKVTTQKVVLY